MYMDGFRRTYNRGHPCLNLFFPEWTLDSRAKFTWAIIVVFLLSIGAEAMSRVRRNVVLSARMAHRSDDRSSWNPTKLRFLVTILHGLQALLGYCLMLATMTFSVELFFSVVFGLATGYAIFFLQEEAMAEQHVTSNPCCNFMEGEARENQGDLVSSSALDTTTSEERTIDEDATGNPENA